MQDKFARSITPGDWIAYGHILDRSGGVRIGRVLQVREGGCVVRGVDDDWGRNPKACERNGVLMYGRRIVLLREEDVPNDYKAAIAEIYPKEFERVNGFKFA